MDTFGRRTRTYSRKTKNNQARLRLVVVNDSGGYKSGRSSCLETPEAASTESTRSAGTRPDRLHFWTAWYRTLHFAAKGCKPPPRSIARSTTFMPDNLQLTVAISQQPRGVVLFPTMKPMVVGSQNEREHFRKALNERVAKDHPVTRGRAPWLLDRLNTYWKQTGRKLKKPPSVQTCGYWLNAKKLPSPEHMTLLCGALGMTRGELFGESTDARLALVVERWEHLPEHVKDGLYSILNPVARTGTG